ncbi:MAG: tRNA (adenosine(37)-N6)-dimethylallyltransferase MiaA [Myxococcales bacterium]|nr:tRNA (adenosine(37)-N6)-dimethylallyltransferase MiaA [Myxococcales bacterium]MCB9713950.1 tRNA (adenosine(37)-N6)-dimethylallyltransferase MiaA [Myxococcales bacterium]
MAVEQHEASASPAMPRVVAIVGPTASGKASLGRLAARRLSLPVLVCDSVKVYRGLDIGSAKPTPEQRAELRHELVDLVDPDEPFSAGDYARHAWPHLSAGRGLVVGGTGFYLRALGWTVTEGGPGADLPPDDPERVAFEERWLEREAADPAAIARALAAVDPSTARSIHPNNHVRLLRALWLCERLHGPVSAARHVDPPRARIQLMMVVVDPDPAVLRSRIESRLDRMLAAGWLREVEKLREAGYDARHKAMRSLGYRQLLEVVEGRCSLDEARETILVQTRQYARRQRAYLRTQLPAERIVTVRDPAACPWGQLEGFLHHATP